MFRSGSRPRTRGVWGGWGDELGIREGRGEQGQEQEQALHIAAALCSNSIHLQSEADPHPDLTPTSELNSHRRV